MKWIDIDQVNSIKKDKVTNNDDKGPGDDKPKEEQKSDTKNKESAKN